MRRFITLIPTLPLILILMVGLASLAACAGPEADGSQIDPRDLSGVWQLREGDRGLSPTVPPMTEEGEARLDANIPVRGRALSPPEPGGVLPELEEGEHRGRARAVMPAFSNDPMMQCNPQGFPRLLFDPELVEFVHLEDRFLQFFNWENRHRQIWLDGREVPSDEDRANLGLAWYGHSVGEWQGDTLLVQTFGLDDRGWLDVYGFPKSDEARFEERYRRIDADTIELQTTMYDPKYYTEPWVSDTKVFRREPPENYTFFGWSGLFSGLVDGICAPLDEVDDFNISVRDPAGTAR